MKIFINSKLNISHPNRNILPLTSPFSHLISNCSLSLFPFHLSPRRGFTLAEVVVVMGIMFILFGIATVALLRMQHQTSLNSTLDVFIADLKEQQIKAMAGETEGSGSAENYGIHFETGSYTLFRNTYGTVDFSVALPASMQISTTLSGSQIVFSQGSGESSPGTITFTNTATSEQKTVTVNRYGVVEGVN